VNAKYLALGALISIGFLGCQTTVQNSKNPSAAAAAAPTTQAPPATEPTTPAAVEPTTRLAVTLINFHLKQAEPEDVFDELARQGGVKFSTGGIMWDQGSLQVAKDVDFTDRPFWSAVREACAMWDLSVQPNYDSGRRITLFSARHVHGGGEQKSPVCETDGFVIEAISFNHQQSVNYSEPESPHNFCSLQLRVYIDPALRVQSFSPYVKTDQAVDDAGNSMMEDKNFITNYDASPIRSLVYDCGVFLKYPQNAGKKIARLRGCLQLRVGEKMDSMTVDKPLEAAETSKTFGDTTVTFHSLKKMAEGKTYRLSVSVSNDAFDQVAGIRNFLQTRAQLLDDKGRAFKFAGGGGGGEEFNANYIRNAGEDAAVGEPAKWVIELPSQTHKVRVPFEFKDLPLP
jgi:hypothetical protein